MIEASLETWVVVPTSPASRLVKAFSLSSSFPQTMLAKEMRCLPAMTPSMTQCGLSWASHLLVLKVQLLQRASQSAPPHLLLFPSFRTQV